MTCTTGVQLYFTFLLKHEAIKPRKVFSLSNFNVFHQRYFHFPLPIQHQTLLPICHCFKIPDWFYFVQANPSIMNSTTVKINQEHTIPRKKRLLDIIAALLILLFVYAAISKLIDYGHARGQMLNQVFPRQIGIVLVWAVPLMELVTAGLLLFEKTKMQGLYLSFGLLSAFTSYIGWVLRHVFSRIPCSCGGVLSHMGWSNHFFFNLFFLAITVTAIFLQKQQERSISDKKTT